MSVKCFPLSVFIVLLLGCTTNEPLKKYWIKCNEIEKNIRIPSFPNKIFSIIDFGAKADTFKMNTEAIKAAIDSCSKSGGGTVLIPDGTYFTGPIHLKCNVKLHLSDKAVLKFSTNPADYLPVVISRWEGVDCYNYSPLIYAYQQENIAITGNGLLDGQSDTTNWWPWKGNKSYGWKEGMPSQLIAQGRPLLLQNAIDSIPIENRIFGEEHYLRPPFIQFYQCKNILVEDVTITGSPFWVIHPLLSENITVRGVTIESHGPNNDGCDPESCKNMLIENCFFNTGDDCIAIKSGRNNDGRKWNIPSENIIIRNCKMANGHGGVVIGSEISGGCKNVFVENCEMNSPELDRAIRIKTSDNRGGIIENIFVRNIKVGEVAEAVLRINCNYEKTEGKGNFLPLVKNIYMANVQSQKSKYAVFIDGIKDADCVYNIFVTNCKFQGVEKNNFITDARDVFFKKVYLNNSLLSH